MPLLREQLKAEQPVARRKWTRERIIQELQDLHAAGEALTVANMRRLGYGPMVSAAYQEDMFGSWRAAVAASGLAYEQAALRRHKWTKARVVARIQQLHSQGQDISYRGIKAYQQYLLTAARRRENFGSWRAAVEAAGIDYDQLAKP